MVDYEKDVEQEAKEFMQEIEDELKEAIKEDLDFDRNDIDVLDTRFHEVITDRSYSLSDAVFVIENSDNEETDTGLWEGQQPEDAIRTKGAYTFSNDVWFKCEEIYKDIKAEYEMQERELDVDAEDYDEKLDAILNALFKEHISTKLEPVTKGGLDEKRLIERWLRLNERAGMRGGYPVGGSYIDARCGTGHGNPDAKDYVDFDHEFAQQVPHLAGKWKATVREYYIKTFPSKET